MPRSVLMLELNELCPPLLERFMAEGKLPNFSRMRGESVAYITETEETQGHLDPWIQWITVHTGVGFHEHGVFKLGDGSDLAVPTVADIVGEAGEEVWLCGPMNVVPTAPVRGWWLPDPWNARGTPVPETLRPFSDFVRANVQEHSNPSARLDLMSQVRFMWFIARNGLSWSAIWATARQLMGERTGRAERWRRAALLDRFQWALFRQHYGRARPALSTYFSNTTAHYQHVYWRHMDPAPFINRPGEEERERFGGAILFGYQEMDRLVGDAIELADSDDDTTLVFCTALSQQPYTQMESSGGKLIYRPHRMHDLLIQLGVDEVIQVSPVMAEQFHVYFASDRAAETAEKLLAGAIADGRPAFASRRSGSDLFLGCALVHEVADDAVLEVPATGAQLPFYEHLYRSETAKSGFHHSQGALWIRTRGSKGAAAEVPVPLRSVAPTLLRLLDLERPPHMRAPSLPTSAEELRHAELPGASSA